MSEEKRERVDTGTRDPSAPARVGSEAGEATAVDRPDQDTRAIDGETLLNPPPEHEFIQRSRVQG